MLNPVIETFVTVLKAPKRVNERLLLCHANGPAPLGPSNCPVKLGLLVEFCVAVLAETFANANAAAPALSPTMISISTTVRVATVLRVVG